MSLQQEGSAADLPTVTRADFPWRPLGELLVERGFVVTSELEAALAEQGRTGRKLGEILVARGAITGAQLTRVLVEQTGLRMERGEPEQAEAGAPSEQARTGQNGETWRPLGRVLLDRGALKEPELQDALRLQRESGGRLGEILVERGYVTSQALVAAVIEQHGLAEEETADGVVTTPLSDSHEEIYQVEDESSEEAKVVFRSDAFLDAVDFAFEYLEAESPEQLRIFRVLGRKREEVWTYGAEAAAAEAEEQPRDLLEVYGYDVLNWRGPVWLNQRENASQETASSPTTGANEIPK
jgi:hypothetical protein